MEKLKNKTFYTIFCMLSSFIITMIIAFNVQSYHKEYIGIKTNLTRINMMISGPLNRKPMVPDLKQYDDKIIMDYNVYSFILDRNNNVIHKTSHNENELDEEIINKVNNILSQSYEDTIKINCLYFGNFAYNFKNGQYLVIIDTTGIRDSLSVTFLISFIILVVLELCIYYVTKIITNWITQPVEETFNKQKEFIADASHELKTPLAIMMASIDCIDVTKKNEKYINNIKSESDRMNNLITKLLDLSKSEFELKKELQNINDLSKIVEKRTLEFESLAFENKINIETKIEKNIMLNCIKSEIDEVIGILIDNAIKHSYMDSTIHINLFKEKNNIILDIINNGEDIPTEDCEKIFERFFRSDKSRNREMNRYGLGLAIAKNIVTNHEGQIKVISENKYTTFRITFKQKKH